MYRQEIDPVTREELLDELEQNMNYMRRYDLEQRAEIIECAIDIVHATKDIYVFKERSDAHSYVRLFKPLFDENRAIEVSRTLSVTLSHLHLEKNMSSEMHQYIQEKIRARNAKEWVRGFRLRET